MNGQVTYTENKERRLHFIVFLLLLPFSFFAQQTTGKYDSLSQGIITVRRPPVPAAYTVKVTYDYAMHRSKTGFDVGGRSMSFPRGNNGWLTDPFPPQPVSVAHKEGDSANPYIDSMRMPEFAKRSDRPGMPFDYAKYVGSVAHEFSWNDSSAIDSARFVYSVDKKGNTEFSATPWPGGDSASLSFEAEALPVMRRLWMWYPAQRFSNRNSVLENIPCTVTIIIYAFKAAPAQNSIIAGESSGQK